MKARSIQDLLRADNNEISSPQEGHRSTHHQIELWVMAIILFIFVMILFQSQAYKAIDHAQNPLGTAPESSQTQDTRPPEMGY